MELLTVLNLLRSCSKKSSCRNECRNEMRWAFLACTAWCDNYALRGNACTGGCTLADARSLDGLDIQSPMPVSLCPITMLNLRSGEGSNLFL